MKHPMVSFALAFVTALLGYAIAGVGVFLNPGDVFTNWFLTARSDPGTALTISYSLWDSLGPFEKVFVAAAFCLPFVVGVAVGRLKASGRGAAGAVLLSFAWSLLAAVALTMLTRLMMGGDNAVSDSLKELAKFLAVAIVPAGVLTAAIPGTRPSPASE